VKCVLDSVRVNPVGVTSKTKGSKKLPRRSIERKRLKWKTKEENPKSDPASVNSGLIDREVAPLKKVQKKEIELRDLSGNFSEEVMFCKLCIAQGSMARCTIHLEVPGFLSGIGALRRM
ncbi:hypothetical protein A2U01_0037374, partial [Trifolium medium]|nr:hypothetical protein [Trifolium medium]